MPLQLHTSGPQTYLPVGQRRAVVQPKLAVNAPGDRYEQEADTMASRAINGAKASVQQQVSDNGEMNAPSGVAAKLGRGGGATLPPATRSVMENTFSANFAQVRVHADAGAAGLSQQLGAKAFTHGNDIYFNQGQYAPQTSSGQHLLAHELTHTIQQGAASGGLLQRDVADPAPEQSSTPSVATAPKPFQPTQEQWQNTTLAPTIYPFRERMYQRLLTLYGTTPDPQQVTGDALYQAVRDTLTQSTIPVWAQQTFLEHAGMRYKSAHGTSLPPWLLADILDTLRNPDVPRQPRRSRTSMRNTPAGEILGQFQQQHADGTIPDDAWQYIVQKTDLRLDSADVSGDQAGYRQVADPVWRQALSQWTQRGYTMWRDELMRTNVLHTTSVVCNELAEITQRHRGVRLPGGIAANSNFFFDRANQTQPTPTPGSATTPAPFFKAGTSVTAQDLLPGASVFFLSNEWKNAPAEAHERVRVFSGIDFPVPWPASVQYRSRQGTRPVIREGYRDDDGWVYHVGDQISRTKSLPTGSLGPEQTEWMRWSHQATVAGRSRNGGITTLETTEIGAGVRNRPLTDFQSQFVFVAWVPDGPDATTTFTPPAASNATYPATP